MTISPKPARAVPPCRILRQELVTRGWSLNDLARKMACPDQTLQKLIEGSEPITWEIAQKLAQALGTSTEFWVNLEGNYLSMAPLQPSIVDDWAHEGPDDPEGDRLLLAEALAESKRYRANPQEHRAWEAFKAELKEAEAAGELPE